MCIRDRGNALSLLYALDDGEPHSQKQLCEQWLIPRTTMTVSYTHLASMLLVTILPVSSAILFISSMARPALEAKPVISAISLA